MVSRFVGKDCQLINMEGLGVFLCICRETLRANIWDYSLSRMYNMNSLIVNAPISDIGLKADLILQLLQAPPDLEKFLDSARKIEGKFRGKLETNSECTWIFSIPEDLQGVITLSEDTSSGKCKEILDRLYHVHRYVSALLLRCLSPLMIDIALKICLQEM